VKSCEHCWDEYPASQSCLSVSACDVSCICPAGNADGSGAIAKLPGTPRHGFFSLSIAAVARWPAARITLRQGARVVHESGQPRASLDHLVGAGEQRGRVR
jgi:hypothetical protein